MKLYHLLEISKEAKRKKGHLKDRKKPLNKARQTKKILLSKKPKLKKVRKPMPQYGDIGCQRS